MSRDGNFVVFAQTDPNTLASDVYIYDVEHLSTTLISSSSTGGGSASFSISKDGAYVAYANGYNVFVYDRIKQTTTLISNAIVGDTSGGGSPTISLDGKFVAFTSNLANIIAGQIDTTSSDDVFLYDVTGGAKTLVSHTAAGPTTTANSSSGPPVISGDGKFVAFTSYASDLCRGTPTGMCMAMAILTCSCSRTRH